MAKGITVDFNANIQRFTSAVDKASNDLNRFQDKVKKSSSDLSGSFNALGLNLTSIVSTLSIGAFATWIKGTIDLADHLNDLSKSSGLTVETLSGLDLAARQSGASLEDIAGSLNKLSINIGKNSETFKKLGITAKDPLEAFKQLSDLFVSIKNPQEQAQLGAATLGKSWATAAPLLAEGSKRIQEMVDNGTALSGMTKAQAEASDQFNDKLEELKVSATGAGNAIATVLVPAATTFLNLITNGISGFDKFLTRVDKLRSQSGGGDTLKPQLLEFKGPLQLGEYSANPTVKTGSAGYEEGLCKLNGGHWYNGKCNDTPQKRASSSSKAIATNDRATEIAKLNAEITTSIQRLNDVGKSEIQLLQEKLDAYSSMDPALKAYNQGLIDIARSAEMAVSDEAAFDKGLQNEIDSFNEAYEAEKAFKEERIASYTAMSEELTRRNEDMNVAIIKDDKKRNKAQIELDNDRMVEKIQNMNLENDQIEELLKEQGAIFEKQIKEAGGKSKSMAQELGMTFTSAFEDAIISGKKFSEVLAGIGQDIERMLVRKMVTNPIMDAIGGIDFGDIFGSIFNANGNAFGSDGVIPFAKGGVFNSPTMFKFANGGKFSNGVLGEAGPEAILPLTRGANGKLGVASSGNGGTSVVVNVVNNADGTQATASSFKDSQGNMTIDIMVEKIEGIMSRNVKRGTGIAPVLEKQYGLNRAAGAT